MNQLFDADLTLHQPSLCNYLKYAGPVGSPPCIEEVVLAGADKPLAAVGKLE